MKLLNVMMAALFLIVLGASSCATQSPGVIEHEEEITQEKNKDKKAEKEEKGTWESRGLDRGYWD